MNRAWIPAGALAGMSVAGLLALGPLTDSLGTTVDIPTTVLSPSLTHTSPSRSSVPVSVKIGVVGSTKTAAFKARGGRAAASPVNNDTGFVANRRYTPTTTRSATGTTSSTATPPPPPPAPKKQPKRQQSIGTTGETNSDQGFAGGTGSSSTGEQTATPGT
jgi:hypothetical protein